MNLSTASSLCLAPLATAFQNERVTVEQYFDNLLAHVTVNGLAHDDDSASPRSRAALTSLVTLDAVCGAFRMWTLSSAYPKLKADDVGPVKQVLLAAWEGSCSSSSSLANLASSPPILQVLVAIAFRRQRREALGCAFALAKRPPDETIFDLMSLDTLPTDYRSLSIWDHVLRSGWIHPVPAGAFPREQSSRAAGWTSIVERGLNTTDSADSPGQLVSFLSALRDNSIAPNLSLLCPLVEKGAITADRMALFCDVFPARRLKPMSSSSQAQSSPNALLRAASLSPRSQEEKCAFLEVLLKQGLDPNWVPNEYVPTRNFDFRTDVDGWCQDHDKTETALHIAVARGEVDVVLLLLRYKAKTDIRDGHGRVALDRLSADSSSAKEIRDAIHQTISKKSGWFSSL